MDFKFSDLVLRQEKWSRKVFGDHKSRYMNGGLHGLMDHIIEECGEVKKASPQDIPEELGDILILLLDAYQLIGIEMDDALSVAIAKMIKNELRVWPKIEDQDPSKPVNHDRGWD